MRARGVLAAASCVLAAMASGWSAPGPRADGEFVFREVEWSGGTARYQVFVPGAVRNGEDPTPAVVLFLHGAGERGTDGESQTLIGLPAVLRERPNFPAVVVMPQAPRRTWWGTPEVEALALGALDAAIAEFGGDPDRIYLTGLSLGGYGTWAFAYKYPERFAALAPVCGGVSAEYTRIPVPEWHQLAKNPQDPWGETARAIADIPVWAFHGARDRRVPVDESRRLVEALREAGASPRYTEYEDVAHDSWTRAYREPGLYEWLFAQRRGGADR